LFRRHLAVDFIKAGHEIIAVAPADSLWGPKLQALGITFVPLSLVRATISPFQDLLLLGRLIRLLIKLKPDYLFCYTIKPVIYGGLAAWVTRVKGLCSMITGLGYVFTGKSLKQRVLQRVVKILYRFVLGKNQKVFFQNRDDAALFQQFNLVTKAQIVFVPGSGVDTEYFRPQFPPKEDASIDFLLIARLLRDKGILEYAQAATRLKQKYPQARFFVAGPYEDQNPSKLSFDDWDKIKRDSGITYLGDLNDVREALADCSVFVLPSYREGMPRVVLEAMAMGKPIITTDTPGCRESIEHNVNGLLVPVKDSGALETCCEFFINDREQIAMMGEESRKRAEAVFDVKKVNAIILESMNLQSSTKTVRPLEVCCTS